MDVNDRLFNAVKQGNLDQVKEITNSYSLSYSKAWAMGYTLLRISTKNKHREVSKYLLTIGAKVQNRGKKLLDTPLHNAATNGDTEIIKMLLERGAYIHAKNEVSRTPLQNAVFRKELPAMELLLNQGALSNEKKYDRSIAIQTAIERNCLVAVEMLLKHGADVNAVPNSKICRRANSTLLHLAAERGFHEIAELLIKNKALITARNKKGHTPVYTATLHGRDKVVNVLLENGANVDDQEIPSGKTLLLLAVEIGSLTIVEIILKYGPELVNKMNCNTFNIAINGPPDIYKSILEKLLEYGFTYAPDLKLLPIAVEKGYVQIVEECLKKSTNIKAYLNNIPKKKTSLIHYATKNKHHEIVEILIKHGANVNIIDKKNKTPLYYASENADLDTLKILLASGASVTKCTGVLINAVIKNCKETVELLLRHEVNINETDGFGRTALHFTALNELDGCLDSLFSMELIGKFMKVKTNRDSNVNAEIAKLLLEKGAKVDARSKDGRTTLHSACLKGYANLVEVLFEYNAKICADDTGTLPLHLCACNGNVDILKKLINKGADINAKNNDGMTAVHFATHEAHTEFLEYLLKLGANVDSKDKHGVAALHIAARRGFLGFIELLLKYDADIDCTDNNGRTALNIATKEGNDQTVMALLEYGCDINVPNPNKINITPLESAMMLGADIFQNLFEHLASDDEYGLYGGSDYDCFDYDSDYAAYYDSDHDYYDDDDDDDDDFDSDLELDHCRDFFPDNQITMILKHHVIMKKAANLQVNDQNLESDGICTRQIEFKTQCEQEVEKLKSVKVCSNTNVTFYDILSKTIGQVAHYARNPKIVEVLKSNEYKIKFPIYCGMINRNFVRGSHRKELLEQGNVFFNLLSDNLSISLPYNCTENIFNYLTDKDLRILYDASKPRN